jgi:transcriptional regulator with XRE-family HTH domain
VVSTLAEQWALCHEHHQRVTVGRYRRYAVAVSSCIGAIGDVADLGVRYVERETRPARRRLGREIVAARKRARKTQGQVARELGVVQSTVSAWERGTRGLQEQQAARLDELLGTSGVVLRAWGRANAPEVLPESYEEVERLEAGVTELREYQPLVFPGLVQTGEYTRALLLDTGPWRSAGEIDRMVEARARRRRILDKDPPPVVSIVVEEYVLRRAVGGLREVLRDQLAAALSLVDAGRVRMQVVPDGAPCHPGGSGPFCVYAFPDRPMVASAEHMKGEQFMDDMMQVQHCAMLFGVLQSEAMSPRESRESIRKAKEELDDHV